VRDGHSIVPLRLRPTSPAEPRGLPAESPRTLSGPGDARGVAPPSEYDHRTPPCLETARAVLELAWFLPGLLAPPAHPVRGSHVRSAGLSTARLRSASRVSHPPDGLTPPRTLPACFIRLALMGFDPSERSSSMAAVAPLGARCRPDVHRFSRPASSTRPSPDRSMGDSSFLRASGNERDPRPAFTALLHHRVRHSTARGLDARRARSSPGVASSPGVPPRASAPASGRLLPRTCPPVPSSPPKRRGSNRRWSHGVSIDTRPGRSLSRPATPPEVFPPCHATPWFTLPSTPGSWFHLGHRPDVTTGPACRLRRRESVTPKSPES